MTPRRAVKTIRPILQKAMAGGGGLALLLAGFVSATPAFGEIGGGGSGANTGGTSLW